MSSKGLFRMEDDIVLLDDRAARKTAADDFDDEDSIFSLCDDREGEFTGFLNYWWVKVFEILLV